MSKKEARRAGTHSGAPVSGPTRDGAEAKLEPNSAQHPGPTAPIATFEKNRRETVRIALNRFEDIDLVDIRAFTGDDRDIATKRGISVRVALLPELIVGLQRAEKEARLRGLLQEGKS